MLKLDGVLPRRLRITSVEDGQILWDHWIYSSDWDAVGLLPEGSYQLQHASSGEPWVAGYLHVGGPLPTYRLFVERSPGNDVWRLDWGDLRVAASVRLKVSDGHDLLRDDEFAGTSLTIDSASPYLRLEWSLSGGKAEVWEIGQRPSARTDIRFDGSFPRRVQFHDAAQQIVWDYWVYGPQLMAFSMLPTGTYTSLDAASGEDWRLGKLLVDPSLPSGRIFVHGPGVGANWTVDWGGLGSADSVHLKVSDGRTVLLDDDWETTRVELPGAMSYLRVELTFPGSPTRVLEVGEPPGPRISVTLSGDLPRRVRLLRTTDGAVIRDVELTTPTLDLSDLATGHYVLHDTGPDGSFQSRVLALGADRVEQFDTLLELTGTLPQRVRFHDVASNELLWDHWIYSNSLDVVGLLPAGTYRVERAASGVPWQTGTLVVGPGVPAYRIYSEPTPDDHLRIDAGTPGWNQGHRARISTGGQEVAHYDSYGRPISIPIPSSPYELTVDPVQVFHYVELPGALPQRVRITDTRDGSLIADHVTNSSQVDMTDLSPGDYLLRHGAPESNLAEALRVTLRADDTKVASSKLWLSGDTPRYVRISDLATQQEVLAGWWEENEVDVVTLLPEGDYAVEHAAPSQNYVRGVLRIGARLPSYRLYFETGDDGSIRADWGDLGSLPQLALQVEYEESIVLDGSFHTGAATIEVPRGLVAFHVATPGATTQRIDVCSLATMAPDGSCQQFDVHLTGTIANSTRTGFVLEPRVLTPGPATVTITRPPRHGTLLAASPTEIVTYLPEPGFVGFDSFTYRIDRPDCDVETGVVTISVVPDANPSRGYFVPGAGTVLTEYGTPTAPTHLGAELPYALLVSSQFGQVIERLDQDGSVRWRHTTSIPGRAVAVYGEEALYTGMEKIRLLSLEDGRLTRTIRPEVEPGSILQFVNPIDVERLLVSWDSPAGLSRIGIFDWSGKALWVSPRTYAYPRWAELAEGLLIVADTFAHRVIAEALVSGNTQFEIPGYFPNDVRVVAPTTLLIAEEHSDRVWLYDWVSGEKSLVLAAPGPRSDLTMGLDELIAISESADLRIDPLSPISKSKSSLEYSGVQSVYAPNGAVQLPDGSFYVVDSDNHRVVYLSPAGAVLAELRGFNGPTKTAWIPSSGKSIP